ncbi:MAG: Lsr2 dimerization domain-containing protein [Streptosporangiaceae bacterium]
MAQKVTVALEDDLEGGPADETMRFGPGGSDPPTERKSASRLRNGEVRAWAKDHDIAVSASGQIPASVPEQYEAANAR